MGEHAEVFQRCFIFNSYYCVCPRGVGRKAGFSYMAATTGLDHFKYFFHLDNQMYKY